MMGDMAETQALTLTDFLLARIAEDEAQTKYLRELIEMEQGPVEFEHDRVMLDYAAKRRIVEGFAACPACLAGSRCVPHDASAGMGQWAFVSDADKRVARLLATVYASHADYDETWRP